MFSPRPASSAIYLDYAATTPLAPEVQETMISCGAGSFGNPSSLHRFGRDARRALDEARDTLASCLRCAPGEIYFTSGGTESDNLALLGLARAHAERGRHVIVSSVEHHAVLEAADRLEREGFRITRLPVDEAGFVRPEDLESAMMPETILVSVMMANNETGAIQPIRELGGLCRERGVLFHTDAVQAAGTVPIDLAELPVDALSLSAHKFYGPKGVGALFVRKGVVFQPILYGGTQERERRAGTENLMGIVGMIRALMLALDHREAEAERLARLRDRLYFGIRERIEAIDLNGPFSPRLPGLLNLSFREADSESLLLNLDLAGIAASSGSACSSGAVEPSHVLLAMGVSQERARSAVRFSLGRFTLPEEIDTVLDRLPALVLRVREFTTDDLFSPLRTR